MGKKDNRMGKKTGYKKERQREKREREKRIEHKNLGKRASPPFHTKTMQI